jgi:hypothetical protein
MCVFISDSTSFVHDGSPPHILRIARQHMNQAFREERIRSWGPVSWLAWSLTSISALLGVGTLQGFGVFIADQWLRGITAARRECMSGDSSETRNFRQSAHLCAMKSWKLCWNAWEPHIALPIYQQALISRCVLTGNFCPFKWVIYSLKACIPFKALCVR